MTIRKLGKMKTKRLTIFYQNSNAFLLVLQSIPYRIYPIVSIFFTLIWILSKRDIFGMVNAEKLAMESVSMVAPIEPNIVELKENEETDTFQVDLFP